MNDGRIIMRRKSPKDKSYLATLDPRRTQPGTQCKGGGIKARLKPRCRTIVLQSIRELMMVKDLTVTIHWSKSTGGSSGVKIRGILESLGPYRTSPDMILRSSDL